MSACYGVADGAKHAHNPGDQQRRMGGEQDGGDGEQDDGVKEQVEHGART